jgi:hypothetical protein
MSSQITGGESLMIGNKKHPKANEKHKAIAADKHAKSTHKTTCEPEITVDRRASAMTDRRTSTERRKQNIPVNVERRTTERRAKVNRRRQIDPTTCERDYSFDEIEFMSAMDNYKRRSGRMFPTCSEVLEVIKSLGYEKRPQPTAAPAMPPIVLPTETPMPVTIN